MYKNKNVTVVVLAFNEQKFIGRVLEAIPEFVDKVMVIDDGSQDNTSYIVKEFMKRDKRILLIGHPKNLGVGGAIASGYKRALEEGEDIISVMAGDGQMDPDDLKAILEPVAAGEADYAKGNRLVYKDCWRIMPPIKYLGIHFLSILTKVASGYWHISDSQCGYTAISRETLEKLELDKIYKDYGVPNDLLIKLSMVGARVKDVPTRPIYYIGHQSSIKLYRAAPKIPFLLFVGFLRRLFSKYVKPS